MYIYIGTLENVFACLRVERYANERVRDLYGT